MSNNIIVQVWSYEKERMLRQEELPYIIERFGHDSDSFSVLCFSGFCDKYGENIFHADIVLHEMNGSYYFCEWDSGNKNFYFKALNVNDEDDTVMGDPVTFKSIRDCKKLGSVYDLRDFRFFPQ